MAEQPFRKRSIPVRLGVGARNGGNAGTAGVLGRPPGFESWTRREFEGSWRSWQTRYLEVVVALTGRVGSNPSEPTKGKGGGAGRAWGGRACAHRRHLWHTA